MGRSKSVQEVNVFLNGRYAAGTIEETLRDRGLNVAGKPRPGSTTVNTQLKALVLGCEAEQLTQDFQTFDVDTSSCLEHHGCKLEGRALEVIIIICMFLPGCIRLAWFGDKQIGRGKRANWTRQEGW